MSLFVVPRAGRRARALLLAPVLLAGCEKGGRPQAEALHGVFRPTRLATSPSSADLMGVIGLDVDSRGNVYVADRSSRLFVFSPDGAVLRTLGRKGQGPGEFDLLADVRVLPRDSVFAFDAGLSRVTVFGPNSDRAAYSVNVGTNAMLYPYWVRTAVSTRGIFAAYRAAFGEGDGRGPRGHRKEVLRLLNPDGSIRRDSVLAFDEAEMLLLHGAVEGVTENPFGRQTIFALGGDDRVYAAWTGALAIAVYSADGRPVRTIRPAIAAAARPITAHDRDSVIAALGNAVPAAVLRRAFAEIGSDSWPLFRDMLVDDADRVWLGLLGGHGDPVRWTAFDQAGAQVASLELPENVSLRVVRGRRAYGVELDEDDVPRVVVYALEPVRTAPARGA